MMSPAISAERLLISLDRLASFGARDDGGVDRVAGSDADLASRQWLAAYLSSAGLMAERDAVGNVFGRTPESRGPWLLSGSHSDTVPAGGRLDGAYGVMAAIEVLRTLSEQRHPAAGILQVVSFWDEEGAQPDAAGGLVGSTYLAASERMRCIRAFLELHIEQGPRMEAEGLELCVVDGIVAIDRHKVSMLGEQNHAGTTPFETRRDAGRALFRVADKVQDVIQSVDDTMVGNIGNVSLEPGAPNVVPGEAHMVVEARAASEGSLRSTWHEIHSLAQEVASDEGCKVADDALSHKPVVTFDADMCAILERVCRKSGRPYGRLFSYAGHDASVLARRVPTAMLFVPSVEGVSHSPEERTPDRFLVQGTQALLDAVVAYHESL